MSDAQRKIDRLYQFSYSDVAEFGVWYAESDSLILDYALEDETQQQASERLGEPVIWGSF